MCNALCKFFRKQQMFFKFILWNRKYVINKLNSSKKEIVLSGDSKKLFVQSFCVNFWSKSKARGGAKSKNRHPTWICCTVVGLPEAVLKEVF